MRIRFERYQQVAALSLAAILFLLDACTRTDGLASTLYIVVLVWFAEQQQRPAVVKAAAACVVLAGITYPFAHGMVLLYDPLFRRAVSCVAIIAATPVILHGLRVRAALSLQDIFLDMTDHPISARDASGAIMYWNGAAERLYGWTAREALGKDANALLSTQLPQPLSQVKAVLAERGFWEGQLVQQCRNGDRVTVENRWLGQSSGGYGYAVLDIATDITALQRVAESLRLSEARYRAIFDTVKVGIWEQDYSVVALRIAELKLLGITDFEKYCRETPAFAEECFRAVRPVDVNATALDIFEADCKSDFMKYVKILDPPETMVKFSRIIAAIANGTIFSTAITAVRTLKGRRISVQISINFAVAASKMDTVLVSIIDDTARRKIQESLAEARESLLRVNRMTALGDMTAKIAHQVNHPLAAIIVNSEAALRWLNRAVPDYREASDAIAAVARSGVMAAEVVAHIRALGTHRGEHRATFRIRDVIEDACSVLERQMEREKIALIRNLPRSDVSVVGDRIEIAQVVLNVLTNAIESLSNCSTPRKIIIRVSPQDETNLLIRIEDNGEGIPQDVMPGLFSPFYTTKAFGMGLGLSTSRAIMSNHGGTIALFNLPDGGAAVEFTLPIATASAEFMQHSWLQQSGPVYD